MRLAKTIPVKNVEELWLGRPYWIEGSWRTLALPAGGSEPLLLEDCGVSESQDPRMPQLQRPPRPWREVAAEVTQERDCDKLLSLIQELNDALDEQGVMKTAGESLPEKPE